MTSSLYLAAGQARVLVESDQPDVVQAARSMFKELVSPSGGPPTSRIAVERDHAKGFTLRCSGDPQRPNEDRLDWSALVLRLEHVLAELLLAGHTEPVHLHAGGANLGGAGVLLLGPSGAGKSTTSVRLLLDGHPIVGDDVVLIGECGIAEPFYRRPKIDAEQANHFGIDAATTVLWQSGSDECWLDPTCWAGWSDRVSVDLVASVRYVPEAEVTTEELNPSELLAELVGAVFPPGTTGHEPDRVAAVLFELASRARGMRVTYGRSKDVAELLTRTVGAPGRTSE